MTQRLTLTCIAAACATAFALPAHAQTEGAQVLFSSSELRVIDAAGKERVAKQGDFLQPGDRVITPPGVFGQIKLPDGTLLSARAESEFRLDRIEKREGRNVVSLEQGHLRVINADLPDRPQPGPMEIVTPSSTLKLSKGDGETAHIRTGNRDQLEPGSYNRLQNGIAIVANKGGELPLQPMQSGFVPRPDATPAILPMLPLTLARFTPVLSGTILRPPPLTLSGTTPLIKPTLTTSVLTSPALVPNLSPTFTPLTSTSTPTLATATTSPALATATPSFSGPTLSPSVSATLQPAVIATVPTMTIVTATVIKPPPPPPPPPPATTLLIKRIVPTK